MALNVKCPNCGTTFVKGDGSLAKTRVDYKTGNCFLIPEEIHNDNVERINKENKNTTNNTEKKEEEKNMSNTINMNGTTFTMEDLAKMVAAQIQANVNCTTTNTLNVQEKHELKATNYPTNTTIVDSGLEDKNGWAKNSKFYGKEICGYAYNPYMIRRFLPAQFLGLMEKYNNNVHNGINEEYTYMYSIEYTIEEVRKLMMLQKRDRIAFEERSQIFTLVNCRNIFAAYIDKVIDYIWEQINEFVKSHKPGKEFKNGFKGYGYFSWGTVDEKIVKHKVVKVFNCSEELNRVIRNLEEMQKEVLRTYSYKNLYEIMKSMKLIKLPKETKKSKLFMDCFIKAGAYYTLKQMLMFDNNVKFKDLTGRAAVEKFRWHLNVGTEGYVIYAMLKEVMGINVRYTGYKVRPF